jgi:SpoVK/Ycf46/Vps4 family AAA+-type ATPase
MAYAGGSGNDTYPQKMILAPSTVGGNYEVRSYRGLNITKLSGTTLAVLCKNGDVRQAMYTVYARQDGNGDAQSHWNYRYVRGNREWRVDDVYERSFAKHCSRLVPLVERFRLLVEIDRIEEQLRAFRRRRNAWQRVYLPSDQMLMLLNQLDLFLTNDPAKPQGLLLKGGPGVGKTLVAQTIAEALSCNFVHLRVPDLKSGHLGQSGQNVRNVWRSARENGPTVMFVDECEAIFGKRGAAETDIVMNEIITAFLGEWNGKEKNVWLIAATNRPDMLDEAIVSRLGAEMELSLPNEEMRGRIFKQEIEKLGFSGLVPKDVPQLTQGFSGRDLEQLARKVRTIANPRVPDRVDFIEAIRAFRKSGNTQVDERSTWDSLIIADETLAKLQSVCKILRDAEAWRRQGVSIPDATLLTGPPGSGKTEVARTLANESGLSFIGVSTADMKANYLGQSANRVKNIFERARGAAPAILFIDELDIVAPARERSGNDALAQEMVGQLLQEMNGIRRRDSHVFVLAATNHPTAVDSAVVSRFTETIHIPLPDLECRRRFLELILQTKPLGFRLVEAVADLAAASEGLSKRDLKNWVARAEQRAIRRADRPIDFSLEISDFESTAQAGTGVVAS